MKKILEDQSKTLKNVERLQRTSNLIQAAELFEQRRIDNETVANEESLKKISKQLEDGMFGKTGDSLNSNVIKMYQEIKKQGDHLRKLTSEESKDITGKAMGRKQYRGIGERVEGIKDNVKDFFSMRGFLDKTGIVKRGTGGLFSDALDRREEKQKYIKDRMTLDPTARLHGPEKAKKIFGEQFDKQQDIQRDMRKNQKSIKEMEALGFKPEQIERSDAGKKRKELATELAKVDTRVRPEGFDPKTGLVDTSKIKDKEKSDIIPKKNIKSGGDATETDIENNRIQGEQLGLLHKIEENTRPAKAGGGGGGDEGGGGILGGIGAGLKALGGGLKGLGQGAGQGIKAFLVGLAQGLKALANPQTLLGLGAVTLAVMGIGKALEMAAPFMEAFAPVLIKIADVVQNVFVAAIEKIPEVISAVGDVVMGVITTISDSIVKVIDAVTGSIERLAAIDGSNLLAVGAGLVAVAGGLVAFSGANVVAGVTNIVSGLLSAVTGQKTPIEQLEDLSKYGPNLEKAGTGVEKLGQGLQAFSSIDADKIKAIAALPTEKIAAMGAAMGNAQQVYAKSGENAGVKESGAGAKNQTNVVNAPVNNVTKQTNIIRAPIRNQDSTVSGYLKSRYA